MRQEGSSLIVIILILSTILLYYTVAWHGNILLWDQLMHQQKRSQLLRDTKSLFHYGIGLYRISNELIMDKLKNQQSLDFTFAWPPESITQQACLYITPIKGGVEIRGLLYDEHMQQLIASRGFVRSLDSRNNTLVLEGWRIE